MKKIVLLTICLVVLGTILNAQKQSKKASKPQAKTVQKPARMLKPLDTIYLEVGSQAERFLIHRVKPKQTLYSLAKYYSVSTSDLYFANPTLRTKGLSVGYMLRIPVAIRVVKRYKGKKFIRWRAIPVYYKVKPRETVFRLAKHHFRMKLDTLKKRNRLKDNTLKMGQLILVGWIDIDGIPPHERKYTGMNAATLEINRKLKDKFKTQSFGKKKYKLSGMAFWNKKYKATSLYALHRTAKIGSIIKVTNPLNRRVLYVKVLDRLQRAAQPYNVKIVLSPTAAVALGAVDSKFKVNLEYYK